MQEAQCIIRAQAWERGTMVDKKELAKMSSRLKASPDNYMESFRRNLLMYGEHRDITLQDVADRADIPVSTLKSLVYGDSKDCSLSTAVKLARVFGVSVDELVGSGTIRPETCESLQIMRTLPETFTHFVRWEIRFHQDRLRAVPGAKKCIEVLDLAMAETGTMINNNKMSFMDISDLGDCIRPKVFVGVRIPSNIYAPDYFEGDVLLLANDRAAMEGERVVVCVRDNTWVLECRYERDENGKRVPRYFSIRDGARRCCEDAIRQTIGYVVKVIRE